MNNDLIFHFFYSLSDIHTQRRSTIDTHRQTHIDTDTHTHISYYLLDPSHNYHCQQTIPHSLQKKNGITYYQRILKTWTICSYSLVIINEKNYHQTDDLNLLLIIIILIIIILILILIIKIIIIVVIVILVLRRIIRLIII